MSQQWDDILVRDTFSDTGVYPTTGNPWQSPDIIPYQSGILGWSTVLSSYATGPDLGKAIVAQGLNNIYVRGKNLQPAGTETGNAALYYSKASLLLLPNQWLRVLTPSGGSTVSFLNSQNQTALNPGDVCLGNQAFLLTNLPPAPGDHWCLITVVNTPKHSTIIPLSFPSNAAFMTWVKDTPAVAYRNISIVPNNQVQLVSAYEFGSTNPSPANFYFQVSSPSGHNFPTNTRINVQCTDPRVPMNWTGYLPQPDSNGNQLTGFTQQMPGNFQTSLTLTLTSPNNQPFPPGARSVLTYAQIGNPDDELEARVGSHRSIAVGTEEGTEMVEAFIFVLGEVAQYVATPGA